jgi:iron complex outermembrane receptor protein
VTNANILVNSADDTWSLNIWGKNLGDEDIIAHINVGSSQIGFMRTAAWEAPRTYGATLGYKF